MDGAHLWRIPGAGHYRSAARVCFFMAKREAGIADSLSGRRAVLNVTLGTATFVRLVNLL